MSMVVGGAKKQQMREGDGMELAKRAPRFVNSHGVFPAQSRTRMTVSLWQKVNTMLTYDVRH